MITKGVMNLANISDPSSSSSSSSPPLVPPNSSNIKKL